MTQSGHSQRVAGRLIPSREARVYDRGVGPGFSACVPRFDSPNGITASARLGPLRQGRRAFHVLPAALL